MPYQEIKTVSIFSSSEIMKTTVVLLNGYAVIINKSEAIPTALESRRMNLHQEFEQVACSCLTNILLRNAMSVFLHHWRRHLLP